MSTSTITCELVDERDLDTRYLAGRLHPDEADSFEEHFFGCERCWGLVQHGLAVQAAHEGSARPGRHTSSATAAGLGSVPRWRNRPWWGLAAAAILVLAVVGIRQLGPGAERTGSSDVFRGGARTLGVTPTASPTSVTAVWPRLSEADAYRVRLYAADGTLAAEREVTDTAITFARDSLPVLSGNEAFWEVQALDRLRNPIARSKLTRAALPTSR